MRDRPRGCKQGQGMEKLVVPAHAGTQCLRFAHDAEKRRWAPAYAGATMRRIIPSLALVPPSAPVAGRDETGPPIGVRVLTRRAAGQDPHPYWWAGFVAAGVWR